MALDSHRLGQRLGHLAGEVGYRPGDAAAQLTLSQARRQRVDRDETAGVDRWAVAAFVVGILEHQLPALLDKLSAERDRLTGLDPDARDPVAQPHGVHGPGVVFDGAAQFLQSARQRFDLEPLEGADHGAFGLKEQLGNWPGGWERLVANRKVEQ